MRNNEWWGNSWIQNENFFSFGFFWKVIFWFKFISLMGIKRWDWISNSSRSKKKIPLQKKNEGEIMKLRNL